MGTRHFTAILDAFAKNDVQSAAQTWAKLAPVVTLLFREPNPMPIKYWLWRQGILTTPECRLPLTSISKALQTEIDTHLATLD